MDENTLEEKCEHLMNVVVESRKKFGKMCVNYDSKRILVENKLIKHKNLMIENHIFKPTCSVPDVNVEEAVKDSDDFLNELLQNQKREEALKQKLMDTQSVVIQLKSDKLGRKLQKEITVEAMLAEATNKINR